MSSYLCLKFYKCNPLAANLLLTLLRLLNVCLSAAAAATAAAALLATSSRHATLYLDGIWPNSFQNVSRPDCVIQALSLQQVMTRGEEIHKNTSELRPARQRISMARLGQVKKRAPNCATSECMQPRRNGALSFGSELFCLVRWSELERRRTFSSLSLSALSYIADCRTSHSAGQRAKIIDRFLLRVRRPAGHAWPFVIHLAPDCLCISFQAKLCLGPESSAHLGASEPWSQLCANHFAQARGSWRRAMQL